MFISLASCTVRASKLHSQYLLNSFSHYIGRPNRSSSSSSLVDSICILLNSLPKLRHLCLCDLICYRPGQFSHTESLSITPPACRTMQICLTSNSNRILMAWTWVIIQYLSCSYDVFCHSKFCNFKPFSLNSGTRKERLLLLLVNSDSEALMNVIRQENKKLSVNIEKILFFCDEYNPISRKLKNQEQEKDH